MKSKVTPTSKEAPFYVHEQFFSVTDKKGIIRLGNDVFVRISQYKESDLIGAPHNIIRHPDMPRAVFKIFWDFLKADSPIGAYVKNMAADGSYYWVFAYAFPVEDGYLSIRFKPTSDVFKLVQKLYAEVLQKERQTSMKEGEEFLKERLTELGFNTYRDFMIHATAEELRSLDTHMDRLGEEFKVKATDNVMKTINEISASSAQAIKQSYGSIALFQTGSSIFINKIKLLDQEFRKLSMLSLNMSVLAANSGDRASTLSIVSEEFSGISGQIKEYINSFSTFIAHLTEVINDCALNFTALKTQMNMVTFFVHESTAKQAFTEMLQSKDIFINLFTSSANQLTKQLNLLGDELKAVKSRISEIEQFINGLRVIRQTGKIESARHDDLEKAFGVYLSDMTKFINLLGDAVHELGQQQHILLSATKEAETLTASIKDNISDIYRLALTKSS